MRELLDKEPARLAAAAASVIVFILGALGISMGNFTEAEVTGIILSGLTIIGTIITLIERVRAVVASPETSRATAVGIKKAQQTGVVPEKAVKAANEILGEKLVEYIPPVLRAAAIAVGLPPNYIDRFGVEATKIAIEAMKKTPTPQQNLDHLKDQMG